VIDLNAAWARDFGAVQVDVGATGHVFAGGAGRRDYGELQVGARSLIGPVELDVSASYAPSRPRSGAIICIWRPGAGWR
jgi:hypothetical protein